ncbi:hypothetical protein [Bradyrhizobium sp. HKCCYLS20291]|uniref:hypothetical protein n=1 Tax=Bradyrhizobium sp. HKCCYLS20291 TaxID=3420766 RepID=UPI003EB6C866
MPKDSDGNCDAKSYAELLEWHLFDHGTRPGGQPDRKGEIWHLGLFAAATTISERTLRNIRGGQRPSNRIHYLVERELFGDSEYYEEWKTRLRKARKPIHAGKDDAAPLSDWQILGGRFTDGLAEARLHSPRPGNVPNSFYVDATLRLGRAKHDYEDRTVSIGLAEAFLSLESPSFQIAKGSMIGERGEHPNFEPEVGGAGIKGPCQELDGCLQGDPLGDEYVAIIEPVGDGKEEVIGDVTGEVSLSVHAGRAMFQVAEVGDKGELLQTALTTNKQGVLNAIIGDGLGRDRQGRLILARARMRRRSRT